LVPPLARHEWAMRISEFVLGHGPKLTTKFQHLYLNGKFIVCSLYKAIIQSDIPVDNNKKIRKMKIPLKTKKFGWYLCRGVILTKDNLVKQNWQGSSQCVFIQVASDLYPPTSVANIFENWLHGIDLRFRTLIMGIYELVHHYHLRRSTISHD
jgi:hypothetical protein